jgi:hypothetical protein
VLGIPEAPKAWHVCEFKTASEKSFREIQSKGVRVAKPEHYAQCMIGMHLSGMDRALYLVCNKNTDDLYAERVAYDKAEAEALIVKARLLIKSPTPPPKLSDDPVYFVCRFCPHYARCHGQQVADVTCRSCLHSTPLMEGEGGMWRCERKGRLISENEQAAGCEDHLYIPDLVPFAEAADAGENDGVAWVEYRTAAGVEGAAGRTWRNGKAGGQYRSVELVQLAPEAVGDATLDEVKKLLGAEVVRVTEGGAA